MICRRLFDPVSSGITRGEMIEFEQGRAYLKASTLRGMARLRHTLRRSVLRIPVPRNGFVKRENVTYYACAWGGKSAVVVKTGNTHRVWVAQLSQEELVEAVLEVEKLRASMQRVELRLIGGG